MHYKFSYHKKGQKFLLFFASVNTVQLLQHIRYACLIYKITLLFKKKFSRYKKNKAKVRLDWIFFRWLNWSLI